MEATSLGAPSDGVAPCVLLSLQSTRRALGGASKPAQVRVRRQLRAHTG